MSGRPPDQLAREVREAAQWLADGVTDEDPTRAYESVIAALAELQAQAEAAQRAIYLATHLFQMIDPETWRAQGGDDGQGHYEGDYWAAQTADELRALAAAAPPPADQEETA